MIHGTHTTKLFFNRFAYQVTLKLSYGSDTVLGSSDRAARVLTYKDWLKVNCTGSHKTNASWVVSYDMDQPNKAMQTCRMRVYLENANDYEAFIETNRDHVESIKKPANKHYEDMIRSGIVLDIRNSLYYGRFRYKMHFRKWWDASVRKQISLMVRDRIHDRTKKRQDYLISRYGASLYLANESDMVIIKMTMPDMISKVVVVATESELTP